MKIKAKVKFRIKSIRSIHRIGEPLPTDTALLIEVKSSLRKEAFVFCQYIIDKTKENVPIFKKEILSMEASGFQMKARCD